MTLAVDLPEFGISDIDTLLCDLGGVVIHLGEFTAMTTSHLDDPWNAWLHSPTVRQHESGQLEITDFVPKALAEFSLEVSEDEFLRQFAAWPGRPYEKSVQQLKRLRPYCELVSLSNTNRFHWQTFASWPGFLQLFHRHLPSFETGLMKPDLAVFHHVLAELDTEPERTLFIDDNEHNVAAARSVGIHACKIQGEDQLSELADYLLDATGRP